MTALRSLLALALVGCVGRPDDGPTWRETWEMLVATDDGGLIDARITVGNTGIYKGQGHLRLDRWRAKDSPINFARTTAPADAGVWAERDRVRVGPDRLGVERRGWTLRVTDTETSAVVHLEDNGGPRPEASTKSQRIGSWTQSIPLSAGTASGWLEAGARGGAVSGHGLVTYRGGDGGMQWPRRAVYVLGGADTSIGVDDHGENHLRWGQIDGRELVMDDAKLSLGPEGALVLDLRPAEDVQIELYARDTGGRTDPHRGLSDLEAQVLRTLGGPPVRRVTLLQGTLIGTDTRVRLPAILVEVAHEDALLALKPRRRIR